MESIKLTFTRAATGKTGFITFWLLMFAIAIDDDRQRYEAQRRKKRDRHARPRRKPPSAPRPF